MKDEKEILRTTDKSIHVMEDFDPSLLENVAAPVGHTNLDSGKIRSNI